MRMVEREMGPKIEELELKKKNFTRKALRVDKEIKKARADIDEIVM